MIFSEIGRGAVDSRSEPRWDSLGEDCLCKGLFGPEERENMWYQKIIQSLKRNVRGEIDF